MNRVLITPTLCGLFAASLLTAADLPHAKPGDVHLAAGELAKIEPAVKAIVDRGDVAGAITMVARQGKIAYSSVVGLRDRERQLPMTEDAIFRIYSMSKPITGAALMMLFDEGKFQLSDPVCRYLPEFKNQKVHTAQGDVPVEHDMTIRELMSHSGGLTYGVFGNSPVDQQYRAAQILSRDLTLEEMVRRLGPIPLEFQPGTRWLYSVSVDVQGRLVEVLSGMAFDQFLNERLFKPLDMRDTDFFVPSNKVDRFAACYAANAGGGLKLQDDPQRSSFLQNPVFKSGGGGLVSTARDYLRFAQMLLNGGELDGRRILKKSTVELMRQNQLPENMWIQFGPVPEKGTGFGLDFAVRTQSEPAERRHAFWWSGMATTRFFIWPESDLVAISMTQRIMDSGILSDPLNEILVKAVQEEVQQNELTAEEKASGWKLLFDGKTTDGWRGFKKQEFPEKGWVIEDGWLKHIAGGGGGDLISRERFTDFELVWEWRIPAGANNGIKYMITEERETAIGHEYQMIDDKIIADSPKQKTASFYDVLPPKDHAPVKIAPETNLSRVLVQGRHVEHWLNGEKVLAYELGSEEVKAAVARSKFKKVPGFGDKMTAHVLLTEHHDEASFRSIKIRPLGEK